MDQVDVVWLSYHDDILARGYWDQALLEDIFEQGNFNHHETTRSVLPDRGAVVIINGRTHTTPEDIEKINNEIRCLTWCLFIETGDEESVFPWREVKHPLMRVWIMLPRMNVHDDAYHLPNGYRIDTPKILGEIGHLERDIPYSFVGQVNHPRREEAFAVAKQFQGIYPEAVVIGTDGFGKEALNQHDYLRTMARSKIVLCPSGIESPDNFRLYEALEAGCIPVVDAFSTQVQTHGFWRYLFGDDIPFPIVSYWDKFPDMIPGLLAEFPERSNRIFAWWQQKKRDIKFKLFDDIKELSR